MPTLRTWLFFACLAAPAPAFAQTRDPAAAQALFDDARRLMDAGRYADACPKLAESQRLDPGIGTQFHLANCQELSGRIATAWALFLDVASQARAAGQIDREQAATARAAKLEPRLPKLRLFVPEASRIPGLAITRDGLEVGPVQWGTPMPLDPGSHELSATAPGHASFIATITVRESEVANLDIPPLRPGTASDPAPAPIQSDASSPPKQDEGVSTGGMNPWVMGLAGVGLVGAGVGTTFALMARSDDKSSKQNCRQDDPNRCNAEGLAARNSALDKANIATIAFVGGAAALAGAALLFVLDDGGAPPETAGDMRPFAAVSGEGAGVGLAGSF